MKINFHCQSILNHQKRGDPTPVCLHFNQAGHSINDVILIPLVLIRSNHDAVRKAQGNIERTWSVTWTVNLYIPIQTTCTTFTRSQGAWTT